jgi:hypothetical protein
MKIDIDGLTEDELIELNHKIISRLRFLREMRSHAEMMNFRIGERVRFQVPDRGEIVGTLTRYNKKSVTVIADNGQRWNVHPGLLFKVVSERVERRTANAQEPSILPFRQLESKKPGP